MFVLSCFSRVQLYGTLRTVSLPGSSAHGIFQARALVLHFLLQGDLSSPGIEPTSLTCPAIGRQVLYHCATWEALFQSREEGMAWILSYRLPLLPPGGERAHEADTSLGADQKIPDWLIKILFLVKTETAVRLGIKYRFGIMGFSTNDAILI